MKSDVEKPGAQIVEYVPERLDVTVRVPVEKLGHFINYAVLDTTDNSLVKIEPADGGREELL